jgi:2-polyprenyl-6-hydroxyphenyl methylase/3-demethylubiquinone-9 3-methyltransferase
MQKKIILNINILCSSPEKLKVKKKFDVILNMEILNMLRILIFF